jgi:pSer/pThr/pTyr-binding forkhead associated (FHA) protein
LSTNPVPALRVLSGGRSGFLFTPDTDAFIAGRHADATLRLHPELDLAVSGRHAEFYRRDGVWHVRDLGSTNGTWLNGIAITGSAVLGHGDVISLGADGPAVRFENVPAESTTQRVRAAVRRQTRQLRLAAAAIIALVIVGAATIIAADRRDRAQLQSEQRLLLMRIDSLLDAGRTAEALLTTEMSGLRAALQQSDARLRSLRSQLDAAARDGADVADLQRQLFAASTALHRQQLAASLDFALIERHNRAAIAMLWIEYDDGSIATGTAFAVRPDGTLLTNRHLVHGQDGSLAPTRIAVRFAGSSQTFPARLLGVSTEWDLAALRTRNLIGDVPTVAPLRAEPPAAGEPVALIGFPLAAEAGRVEPRVATPLTSAGVVLAGESAFVEVQGLGAAGGSGSPVLDRMGHVVAILFGGRLDTEVQVLLAVPAAAAARFLDIIP